MFRKNMTTIVCLLLALMLIFTACGGKEDPKKDVDDPVVTGADEPEPPIGIDKKEEMVVGIPILTTNFNFYHTTSGYETFSMAQVYDTLVVKNDVGGYVPSLAEDFTISEDATTFTFHLNKNAKWSNGKPVTASDVKYSLEEAVISPYVSWIYEPILKEVNVIDEHTAEVVLNKNSVSFLEYLSNPFYCAILSEEACKEHGEDYGSSIETTVSSGPYKVVEWIVGDSLTYQVNEDYYLDPPEIKKVKLVVMNNPETAMIALQTGELDAYFDDVPGVSYDKIKSDDNIGLVDYTSTILFATFLNSQKGMFSDPNMRKAVALAVKKEDYITVGTEGFGVAADYPGDRGENATTGDPRLQGLWDSHYEYNLEKAKSLVEDAGHAGESVVIKTYSTDPYPELATVMQGALTAIGLDATIEQMERSNFIDQVLAKGDFDINICRWAAGTEDMDEIIYGSLHTDSIGSPGNWSFYSNDTLDKLITDAAAELDNAARKALYKEILEIFAEEAVYIPLYYPTSSRAYGNTVTIDPGYAKFDKFCYYKWNN